MPTTTTTQFGRRGAPSARDAARPGAPPPSRASAAFEAATRWNRSTAREPSLNLIFAPLPSQDVWIPKSDIEAPADAAPPPRGLAAMLFGFSGRMRRRDFWIMGIANWVASLVVTFVCLLALPRPMNFALLACASFVTLFVSISLQVKRWHDRGRSGMWVLLIFIPIVGPLWGLIECGFLPGAPGPNRYGASPK